MSMSTHVHAYMSDNNPDYQKHKKVLLACIEADVMLPPQTMKFFNTKFEWPDESLLEESLEVPLTIGEHYDEYNENMQEGFEVFVNKLPENVDVIRFVNSY